VTPGGPQRSIFTRLSHRTAASPPSNRLPHAAVDSRSEAIR
jgi:hypothetical protein